VLGLIAMARRTVQAERDKQRLSELLDCEIEIGGQAIARMEQAERERDEANEKLARYLALTDTFDHERQQYHEERDEARAERDALLEQAVSAGMKVEALASKCTRVELERDALREILTRWYEWESLPFEDPFSSQEQQELLADTRAALAQPTDAGGAE
jgi:hypothetical protein